MRHACFVLLATLASGVADVKPGYVAVEKASGHEASSIAAARSSRKSKSVAIPTR